MAADLTRVMAGSCMAGMDKGDVSVITDPVGSVPDAVPMLSTLPLSRSAWVVV